ncbi:MAG: hypothetical protein PHP01_02615 [Phycisphaerae bacterium]|nr:hypothetical protein [Phycisphaerae bacterium]
MDALNKQISAVKPVNEAIERTKLILFRPFDLGKWFIIGFCAFLAEFCRETFGGGLIFKFNDAGKTDNSQIPPELMNLWHEHTALIIATAAAVAILLATVWILIMWLSSRGQFMFLDCLVQNKAYIKEPWGKFKHRGNGLFGFRLLAVAAAMVIVVPLSIFAVYCISILKEQNTEPIVAALMLAIMLLAAFAVSSFFGTVKLLTIDFVVPIMYIHKTGIWTAWRKLWPILWNNIWKMTIYLLFKMLIICCIGLIVLLIICIGCCFCCASTLIVIPYLGAVILLPFSSFYRLYSLFYFRQYGPEFDVFAATE